MNQPDEARATRGTATAEVRSPVSPWGKMPSGEESWRSGDSGWCSDLEQCSVVLVSHPVVKHGIVR